MIIDVSVIETGNGGDLQLSGNDIAMVEGLQSMIYLALFGGNVRGEWWGNNLLMPNQPSIQFISQTERTLQEVALNSAGRVKIEQAVKNDLKFLQDAFAGVNLTVTAYIVSDDEVNIKLSINGSDAIFIWNMSAGNLYPGFISPEFLSTELFGFLISEDGTQYFQPD